MTGDKKEKKKEKFSPEITSGVFIFPNGDKYEGDCIQTELGSLERNGQGTHTSVSGIVYEGSWANDNMNGKGKLTHPSNAVYEGDFVNNQFHGHGKYTWPDGSYYVGTFLENRLEGEGEFYDTEGQIWTGAFRFRAAPGLKFKLNMN
ncbi:MORN repeat-containing protein 2 [Biomphalaria pfeifferi]|uniref:MORN repeat-containing protein 2 n=1 Tax=Biomphalaria pfeifferi TaxID=112525 RepID=A0AAD8BHM1_BIOPF|nr:MORN repeat-containing protein 2 [Biomphalaria pfeifferi]